MSAFCAGIAAIAAPSAHAFPSALGAYPSTDVYTKENIHLDVASYSNTNLKNIILPTAGLTYGIGPDKSGLLGRSEIGFDFNYSSAGSVTFAKRIFFNAKTQLYNDDKQQIRVVAGGWNLGDSTVNPNYVYLLASKNFNRIGRFHVGYAYGISRGVFNTTSAGVTTAPGRSSLHLAYDRLITPKLQFVVDYYSGKSAFAGVQPTLYYSVNDKAGFGVGYFRLNNKASTVRNQLYLQFLYNFDFKKAAAPTTGNSNPAPSTGTGPAAGAATNGGPAPVPTP